MEEKKEAKTAQINFKNLAYLASGVAIGSAAGVLLAPDSGKETRRKIGHWLKEKREARSKTLAAKKEQIAHAIEAGRNAYRKEADKILSEV